MAEVAGLMDLAKQGIYRTITESNVGVKRSNQRCMPPILQKCGKIVDV